jgi:hypothetical protein
MEDRNIKIISDEEMVKYAKITIEIMKSLRGLEPQEQMHIIHNIYETMCEEFDIELKEEMP